jgi:hypothetical protein
LVRDGRICAGDLLHPMQARWLLRYVPIHDSNGGRDGTRTHFFHRDRVDSRLFEFTPHKLAPGAGVAPTPAASKAVELLLFDPGMVGRQGLAP